ncbi:hypothetical protein BU16DRAFT_18947 [Lophium mytilinum]|uniref:Uncharacterized protein n=1 Tax=Lophium mytilinum TaxID=390894 RepID=A0A6A6RGF0_9PEZI|nr:hypothetical protein BU16DRAFT_18947 [Lophium mytilinum]
MQRHGCRPAKSVRKPRTRQCVRQGHGAGAAVRLFVAVRTAKCMLGWRGCGAELRWGRDIRSVLPSFLSSSINNHAPPTSPLPHFHYIPTSLQTLTTNNPSTCVSKSSSSRPSAPLSPPPRSTRSSARSLLRARASPLPLCPTSGLSARASPLPWPPKPTLLSPVSTRKSPASMPH